MLRVTSFSKGQDQTPVLGGGGGRRGKGNLIIHLFSNTLDLRIKAKLKKNNKPTLKHKMKGNRRVKISRSQEKKRTQNKCHFYCNSLVSLLENVGSL